MKKALIIVLMLTGALRMQAQSCFARVQLDRRSVYVQQPFKVTITVLTSTWFTAPIAFDNLQVPDAFVLPFDRNYPGMFDANGKQYAGIQFHFIVFPYRAGQFTIPPIVVHATTPPEGSSESKPVTIKTPLERFSVKPVPVKATEGWFVARSVTLRERWNKSLSQLKVGDILERTITIYAGGTLPQFIPALKENDLPFANVYPQDPELRDLRNDHDANGELTQSFIYLMEKDGAFTIPGMELQSWNPSSGRMNKHVLPAHKIVIQPNPDLGMVATIRDSLNVAGHAAAPTGGNEPKTIFGMTWYGFAACAVAAVLVLYILIRLVIKTVVRQRLRYAQYRSGELYRFRRLMAASPSSDAFWRRLYQWWDRAEYDEKENGLATAFRRAGDEEAVQSLESANQAIYRDGNTDRNANRPIKRKLKHMRKWLLNRPGPEQQAIAPRQSEWHKAEAAQ